MTADTISLAGVRLGWLGGLVFLPSLALGHDPILLAGAAMMGVGLVMTMGVAIIEARRRAEQRGYVLVPAPAPSPAALAALDAWRAARRAEIAGRESAAQGTEEPRP